jgi:hypothetical protein
METINKIKYRDYEVFLRLPKMFNAPANYNKITAEVHGCQTSILQKATGRWNLKQNVEE